MGCEMMTAGRRCVLGWIDVNVEVDEDDSLMFREGRKGRQRTAKFHNKVPSR